jgi:hypothetical protein
MTLVRLDFACNDPDNGLFDGQCAGIQLPDLDLELSSITCADRRSACLSARSRSAVAFFRLSAARLVRELVLECLLV